MMLANVPAVYLGQAATKVVPLNVVRMIAAGIFAAIGVWVVVAALTATQPT
jgi:putative Ca2+/H+ antiporter (TMEM165/GDT1 family)